MRKPILAAAVALFSLISIAHARDSIDGDRVVVTPYKDGMFATGEYRFGKAELFGYIGDLKDHRKLTGLLLRDGGKATPEQKHLLAEIAKAQELNAIIELDGHEQPLVDPAAPAAAAAGASAGK
jgi:hypothetical protein